MVSLASSSSRSGAPALVAGSAWGCEADGRPDGKVPPPLPALPGYWSAGASGTRDPCPRRDRNASAWVPTPALPSPAPRGAPLALPPDPAHAAGVPRGKAGGQSWGAGDPGSLPPSARGGSVPAAPVTCRRVAAPGPPSGGGGGRSGEPPGRGSRAGHSPQPGYDAVEGVTHQSGPPLGAAAAAEGPRWRRWPGPEAPPLSAPRPPAGKDLRGEVAARQPAAAYPPRPRPPRLQSGSCRAPHRSLALQPRLRRPPPTFRPRPDVQSQPAHFLICVPSSLKGLKYAGLRAATYPGQ